MFRTVDYQNGVVRILDQTRLPLETVYLDCTNYHMVAEAIQRLRVRGAPAIGVTAALGVTLGLKEIQTTDFQEFSEKVQEICRVLAATRPTAVNLFWALERIKALLHKEKSVEAIKKEIEAEAIKILEEDVSINRRMGEYGHELIHDGDVILTHCNAGSLATAGFGTALGVIRAAVSQGKQVKVWADETRPLLQGARLTAWELLEDGIPVTLITDNMAGYFMKQGKIDLVIVGADRIAANGDVANKIGTYSVAVLAKEHGIPFYVAAPLSTIDISLESGEKIPIEERDSREVTHFLGQRIAPEGVEVANPAFDVTPHPYVKGIITEVGVLTPPYTETIRQAMRAASGEFSG